MCGAVYRAFCSAPTAVSPALPAGPQAQALGLVLVLLSFPTGATSLVSKHLLLRKTRCHWVSQPRMGQHRSWVQGKQLATAPSLPRRV